MQINKPDIIIAREVSSSNPDIIEARPVTEEASLTEVINDILGNAEGIASAVINKVSKEINESSSKLLEEESTEEIVLNEENSKNFIQKVISFLSSRDFDSQCESVGSKYSLPPKVVAKNFCLRILGTIGDVLGIAINVTRNFIKGTIHLLVSLLYGSVDLICNVALGLSAILTLNQTAQPSAR